MWKWLWESAWRRWESFFLKKDLTGQKKSVSLPFVNYKKQHPMEQHKTIVFEEHTLHYRDEGREHEQTLVLLHGYLQNLDIWSSYVLTYMRRMHVITIDLPGHGYSECFGEVHTMDFMARAVKAVLDDAGVEQCVMVGHSMGGYVAQLFLADWPGLTEGVILLCSHPYPDAPEKAADREAEKKTIRAGKMMTLAAMSIPKMYYEENLRTCDEKIRETVELCEMHDPEGICSSLDGLRLRPDLRSVLADPARPVLVIHGDHDNFLPLSRIEEMRTAFPKLAFALIPGSGHNAFIERQDAVVEAIGNFTSCPA